MKPSLVYNGMFMTIRIVFAINVSVTGLMHPAFHVAIYLLMSCIMFFTQLVVRIFDSVCA